MTWKSNCWVKRIKEKLIPPKPVTKQKDGSFFFCHFFTFFSLFFFFPFHFLFKEVLPQILPRFSIKVKIYPGGEWPENIPLYRPTDQPNNRQTDMRAHREVKLRTNIFQKSVQKIWLLWNSAHSGSWSLTVTWLYRIWLSSEGSSLLIAATPTTKSASSRQAYSFCMAFNSDSLNTG